MFVNIETLEVLNLKNFNLLFPQYGFTDAIESSTIYELGWVRLEYDPQPAMSPFQYAVAGAVRREGVVGAYRTVQAWTLEYVDKYQSNMLIDMERDRRLTLGVTFRDHLFQTRDADRETLLEISHLAVIAILHGAAPGDLRWADPDEDFTWISADNTAVPMDAQGVTEFFRAVCALKSTLRLAGRRLKDLPLPPANYADDSWWS